MKEVYVLLVDRDGTLRSRCVPFGVAVETKEEAKRFVKESKVGYARSYEKAVIFANSDEAVNWAFTEGS